MKFDRNLPLDAEVAQGLAALKREGGSVLLVGTGSDAQGDICGRFLAGDDDRVFVDTDSTVRNDEETAETVIERPFSTRSSAAGSAQPGAAPGVRPLVSDLETAMRETATGDAVHVCFDSLRPFVDTTDVPTLVSSLESLRETAGSVGAVVHLHLPAMPEAVPAPLFDAVDAVAEVRRRGGTTYQRWRLPADAEPTDWIPV
jgi:hypothetical protein